LNGKLSIINNTKGSYYSAVIEVSATFSIAGSERYYLSVSYAK
jgi:hypothetical protein